LASAFLEANKFDLDASGQEIDHVFRHAAGSDAALYEAVLDCLTNWFEKAIRPLAEEG